MLLLNKVFAAIRSRLYGLYKFGNAVSCCLCDKKSLRFFPYRGGSKNTPLLIKALDGVGSDVDNFGCPHCGSTDRERHLYLYLDRLRIWSYFNNASILHFAPEQVLSKVIDSMNSTKWIRADLFPTSAEFEKIDLLAIPYEDMVFDIVIVNHVLEHVPDDMKALKEIYRVLRHGGLAILQTPYCEKLEKTFSDNGIDTDNARLQAYGQEDHVRLYGKDIFDRIVSVGFLSRTARHYESLADISPSYYGVNPKEPLFLFEKL
jgi:SAM-dependent methyltransferase